MGRRKKKIILPPKIYLPHFPLLYSAPQLFPFHSWNKITERHLFLQRSFRIKNKSTTMMKIYPMNQRQTQCNLVNCSHGLLLSPSRSAKKGLQFLTATFRKGESRTKSVFPGATGPQTLEETRRNDAAEQRPAITIITSRHTLDGRTPPSIKWVYRTIHFVGLNLVVFGFHLQKLPRMHSKFPPN